MTPVKLPELGILTPMDQLVSTLGVTMVSKSPSESDPELRINDPDAGLRSSDLQPISRIDNLLPLVGRGIIWGYPTTFVSAYNTFDMFFGFIPGSVGETSTFLIIIGALFLMFTKIASWRIILSAVVGAAVMGLIFNGIVDQGWITESSKFYGLMSTPFWKHLIVGGIAFGITYMATDPVSGSQTNKGKYWYGFLIGFFSIM